MESSACYVEALANIGLRVANVEQFLAIACSLAEDNPSICERVRQAAQAAHSACLLIDHLRCLFAHQEAAWQQASAGRAHLASGTSLLGEQQAREQQAREQQAREQQAREQQRQQAGVLGQHEHNLSLFSYSNMRALQRAARSLVANLAKIVYLTDTVVLQGAPPTSARKPSERAPSPNGAQPAHAQLRSAQLQVSRLVCRPGEASNLAPPFIEGGGQIGLAGA